MEDLWYWAKVDTIDGSGYPISGSDRCAYFQKELWFELVNIMWSKHRSTFQDHDKYIHNDIVKPFRVVILQYAERVCEMHDLAKYLPPPLTKGQEYNDADWDVCDK